MNLLNYNLISKFNEIHYKDLLFDKHLIAEEIFIDKAKNMDGDEEDLQQSFYVMNKDNKSFILPSEYIKLIPIKVNNTIKISWKSKVYHLIEDAIPKGFGGQKTYNTFKEYIDSMCKYVHSSQLDYTLFKIIGVMGRVKRLNVRVASEPAFGKDSFFNVTQSLLGDVGMVQNPTLAKIEWLLTNHVVVTNEVADIKSEESTNLQQYYLSCGAFSVTYEKRSIANYKGSHNTYDISKLSNFVLYNNLECYPLMKQKKYFDYVFPKQVKERFLPFKFDGKITEDFEDIVDSKTVVNANLDYYKNLIKMTKWLEKVENFESCLHKYDKLPLRFTDRYKRNFDTICQGIDAYAEDYTEYSDMVRRLFECYKNYQDMVKREDEDAINNPFDKFEVEEEMVE